MSIPVEKIAEFAVSLPSNARALLADRLAESLDPLTDDDARASWAAEALNRLTEVRCGKVTTIPGDEALARVRTLLR